MQTHCSFSDTDYSARRTTVGFDGRVCCHAPVMVNEIAHDFGPKHTDRWRLIYKLDRILMNKKNYQ